MTRQIEIINGHRYLVTRDENGNIVEMIGADTFIWILRRITKWAFRHLFTQQERVNLDNFDLGSLPAATKARIRSFLADFAAAHEVDLDDPEIIQAVNFMENQGIIAPGRAAQILANTKP